MRQVCNMHTLLLLSMGERRFWFGLVISGFEKVENGEGFACGNWRMRQREMGVGKGFPNGIGNGRWVGRRA